MYLKCGAEKSAYHKNHQFNHFWDHFILRTIYRSDTNMKILSLENFVLYNLITVFIIQRTIYEISAENPSWRPLIVNEIFRGTQSMDTFDISFKTNIWLSVPSFISIGISVRFSVFIDWNIWRFSKSQVRQFYLVRCPSRWKWASLIIHDFSPKLWSSFNC